MGTRVYIGGLPYRVKERDIERFFRGYGKLREVLIKNGYGFVEFEDYRDADDAVYELNGKELCGERVTVERAKGSPRARGRGSSGGSDSGRSPRNGRDHGRSGFRNSSNSRSGGKGGGDNAPPRYGPPTRTDYRLVVENLSSRVSWQDLKDYMRQAGEVTYADAHKQHRNEGVVEFASYSDLKTAIEKLDGTDLNGRRIKLVEDKDSGRRGSRRRSRSRSSSRSRSRSRSRRRSRSRSRSRSQSRSRSKRSGSKSRSRSKSRGHSKSKSKSRSRSPRKSRSKSRSRDKSMDRSKSKSHSRSPRKSRSKSRSRDKSVDRDRSVSRDKSVERAASKQSRSKSRERSHSRSRSRSVSRSRSASGSPRRDDRDEDEKMDNGHRSSPDNRD